RTILQRLGEAVLVTDRVGHVVYMNDRAAGMLRHHLGARSLSMDALLERIDVLDLDGYPVRAEELPERVALRTGQPASAILRLVPRDEGEERWTAVTASTIPDDAGRPALAVSVLRDITFLRRAQE